MPAISFRVTGRVQGVGFRAFTQRTASRLDLAGWCRNTADGAVEGQAAGDDDALDALREALEHGPPAAVVDDLAWAPCDAPDLDTFVIRR